VLGPAVVVGGAEVAGAEVAGADVAGADVAGGGVVVFGAAEVCGGAAVVVGVVEEQPPKIKDTIRTRINGISTFFTHFLLLFCRHIA
jgi:hypothetical protein